MKQIVFGLGNKARHGKDTVASAIRTHCEANGIPVKVVAFADALRREVNEAISAVGNVKDLLQKGFLDQSDAVYDYKRPFPDWVKPSPDAKPEPGMPYGKHSLLLQYWGSEYRRAQDPDYWVKKWKKEVQDFQGVVIAQDVRFPNEAYTVTEMGGVTVNVTRLNTNGIPFQDPGRDPNHQSETSLDGYNWHYRLTAHTGELAWLEYQALTLFDYVYTRLASEPAKVVPFVREGTRWHSKTPARLLKLNAA